MKNATVQLIAKSSPVNWRGRPEDFTLSDTSVHVWLLRLDQETQRVRSLYQTLSEVEQQRAGRFRLERDRNNFVSARGTLRLVLGWYTGIAPEGLEISIRSNGKPYLVCPLHDRLKFNLSHSADRALLAVSRSLEVGVDLEKVREMKDAESVASRFFSSREAAYLSDLPQVERLEAFFRFWTCKEAYLKATGEGLMRPTESVEVLSFSTACATEGKPNPASGGITRRTLLSVVPEPGYVAAVAVEGDQQWVVDWWDMALQVP